MSINNEYLAGLMERVKNAILMSPNSTRRSTKYLSLLILLRTDIRSTLKEVSSKQQLSLKELSNSEFRGQMTTEKFRLTEVTESSSTALSAPTKADFASIPLFTKESSNSSVLNRSSKTALPDFQSAAQRAVQILTPKERAIWKLCVSVRAS